VNNVTLPTILKICAGLKVTVSEFFDAFENELTAVPEKEEKR
jgi:DNA-binding Xre family transcriptional regulator